MAEAAASPPKKDPVLEFINKHAAITAGIAIFMLSLVKLAAVTHYDPTTMLALANTVGATSILTGTFFSPPWPGLLVLTTLCIRWFLLARDEKWSWVVPAVAAAFFALFLAVLLPPTGALILGAILVVIGAEWAWRKRRKRKREGEEERKRKRKARIWTVNILTVLVLLYVFVWSAFFNSDMWLPKEILFARESSSSPGHVIEGYVLSIDGDWTNILVSGQRKVMRMPAEWVKERTVCLHHHTQTLWWTKLPWWNSVNLGEPPQSCETVRERVEGEHPGATSTHDPS